MVYLGTVNSRMKDFYDVWLLARQFAFDGALLARAIGATFTHRGTTVEAMPVAFTPRFTAQPSTLAQWSAFRKKLPADACPETLAEVVAFVAPFLLPVVHVLDSGESPALKWPPGGPWSHGA